MKKEKEVAPILPEWSSFFLKFQSSLSPPFSPHWVYLCDQIDNFLYQILSLFRFRGMSSITKIMLCWTALGVIWLIYAWFTTGYYCIGVGWERDVGKIIWEAIYIFGLSFLFFIISLIHK